MLRCRKCRKAVADSTYLIMTHMDVREEDSVCSIWHVNVDELPDWILSSVQQHFSFRLFQAQWTSGKLSCNKCGARLGGFNFIHRSKCPCGQEASVHFNKSRVDNELLDKHLVIQPRRPRPVLGQSVALLLVNSEDNHLDPVDTSTPQTEGLTVLDSQKIHFDGETSGDAAAPVCSSVSRRRQLFREPKPLVLEGASETSSARDQPHTSTVTTSSGSVRHSKREMNQQKKLQRKQKKREQWLLRQQQTETDSEDDKDREGLICPVCLDVFFRPHSCKPCGHVFCEPCLRRVAKNRARSTPCPLCRSIISYTDVNKDLNQTAMTSFPKLYNSRRNSLHNTQCSKWMLPRSRGFQRLAAASHPDDLPGILDISTWIVALMFLVLFIFII
ncbi:E3 ubiquitin-protein ligase RNF180 isoform X2 [Cynoglossus semilaevis]|uniref:E3 ubiquitin-protein ligase RNF180 isoform X2 n=1 Tax=Cynoglossus semilaevis TaxID=244447 RepID=UPI0004974765|nr:E3 ubiquitin-protein ligase RNF180 isoform X2 [Cynoglossus semilaevis]